MPADNSKWYSIRRRAISAAVAAATAASGAPETPRAEAEIYIYGDIGMSWYQESTSAADFVAELASLDVQAITVRINSIGGSVPDGLAIYNALKRHPATITCAIDGAAMSVASLVAMAGDTVEMADNALLMIHAPWVSITANSAEMREVADMLDVWAAAMATSYAEKTGRPVADMLALLTDGEDHWYTAEQAIAEGFADDQVEAMPIAAMARIDVSRFPSIPAAAAALFSMENVMPTAAPNIPAANPSSPATPTTTVLNEAEIRAAALREDSARRTSIQAAFARFSGRSGVAELLAACQNDPACTPEAAGSRLLDHLGAAASPSAAGVQTVEDETDKRVNAITAALLHRAGIVRAKTSEIETNPYRGHKMLDLARASLARLGTKTDGMPQMGIVAAAFTTTSSDFPILLENTMHKSVQVAYATAQDTWSRFCHIGNVSDFRAHNRYRPGSFGNLDSLNEVGEFKNKSVPDAEKAQITAGTKGNIINISRQAIINDDLDAFVGLSAMLGRAARRTIEADVYALLISNPVMPDGNALFHASHNNLATGAAPGVDAFDAMRVAMSQQKDVSGNDYLDVRPAIWLGPVGIGGNARVINNSQYDTDTPGKFQRPNKVVGLFREVIDTPRLSGTAYYMLADKDECPTIEVAFLDGNQEPYLELQNGFNVDGAQYKVRLDYGTAAIDFKGAQKNPGA